MKTTIQKGLNVVLATFVALVGVSSLMTVNAQSDYEFDDYTYDDSYSYDYETSSADAEAAAGIMAGFGLVFAIIGCVITIIWIVVTVLVFKDAKKHSVENPVLWAVLTFFLSWLGLLIYFLVPRKKAIEAEKGTATKTVA